MDFNPSLILNKIPAVFPAQAERQLNCCYYHFCNNNYILSFPLRNPSRRAGAIPRASVFVYVVGRFNVESLLRAEYQVKRCPRMMPTGILMLTPSHRSRSSSPGGDGGEDKHAGISYRFTHTFVLNSSVSFFKNIISFSFSKTDSSWQACGLALCVQSADRT